jgi:fructose-bisphosphate aldolase class II
MPIVDYKKYIRMLDKARNEGYAYPAINVTATDTMNAAIEGFVEAKSDGIIQVSTGGGEHASGNLKDGVLGAISLAEARSPRRGGRTRQYRSAYRPCSGQGGQVLKPLSRNTAGAQGGCPMYNSHMFDGSDLPLAENMKLAVELLKLCHENEIILEVEAGVVGGEEDGVNREGVDKAKLYTTPDDMLAVHEALSQVKGARYMFAATFGNVHGVYKPGNVVLKPKILQEGQDAVVKKYGEEARFWLVFHGGSGSSIEDIHETLDYGVIKMNVDTDTQYAFTRPVADHMFKNYNEVLKVDGEVGNKKKYDPRSWMKAGRAGMAARVVQACKDLKSDGKTMGR